MVGNAFELKEGSKVVFKIGTGAIERRLQSRELGLNAFLANSLAAGIADNFYDAEKGFSIYPVLVTSGAVYCGMQRIGLKQRPTEARKLQALASIGEPILHVWYDNIFRNYGLGVSQFLLTQQVLEDDEHTKTIETMFKKMYEMRTIPRCNENDAVDDSELRRISGKRHGKRYAFSDNSKLAGHLAVKIGADLVVFITDVPGIHDRNPKIYPDAEIIRVLIPERTLKTEGNGEFGTGGMKFTIDAVFELAEHGIPSYITGAESFWGANSINDLLNGKSTSTYCPAYPQDL